MESLVEFVKVDTQFIDRFSLGSRLNPTAASSTPKGRAAHLAKYMYSYLDYYTGQCHMFNISMVNEYRFLPIR